MSALPDLRRQHPIVDPDTGQIVAGSLGGAEAELLAELVPKWEAARRRAELELDELRQELRRRVKARGEDVRSATFAGYEVTLAGESKWDAHELEGVARFLRTERTGLVAGFPLSDMFKRGKLEVVGTVANRLLKQLPQSEKRMVEDCRVIRTHVRVKAPVEATAIEEQPAELEEAS